MRRVRCKKHPQRKVRDLRYDGDHTNLVVNYCKVVDSTGRVWKGQNCVKCVNSVGDRSLFKYTKSVWFDTSMYKYMDVNCSYSVDLLNTVDSGLFSRQGRGGEKPLTTGK